MAGGLKTWVVFLPYGLCGGKKGVILEKVQAATHELAMEVAVEKARRVAEPEKCTTEVYVEEFEAYEAEFLA